MRISTRLCGTGRMVGAARGVHHLRQGEGLVVAFAEVGVLQVRSRDLLVLGPFASLTLLSVLARARGA